MPVDPLSMRRLYGRSKGHPLRAGAERRMSDLLPRLAIPATGPLAAPLLFGRDCPLALEVGSGKGEHLAFQAALHPDWGFLASEPYQNGVAGLLADIEAQGLANIRIHMGDGLDVLERLADSSLSALYLLHPDPWPKARHQKRRFINPGPVQLAARKLKPGAEFRIATDHPGYVRHALLVMAGQPDFLWTADTPADWRGIPADWPDTRFGAKARQLGHEVWRLIYRRV